MGGQERIISFLLNEQKSSQNVVKRMRKEKFENVVMRKRQLIKGAERKKHWRQP